MKPFETDILKLRADELNYTLCMFVKEVKKPNGDSYAADSILYLTLGIQVTIGIFKCKNISERQVHAQVSYNVYVRIVR